ncbi:hypothetical protein D3C59_20230 [Streptomyces sp. SHP22-7]|nr:hypothetical protein D3C59_20230 [Streptomyces sp. SHP22-7]
MHDEPVVRRPARPVGEADTERTEKVVRPRRGVGGLPQPQPLGRVAGRVVGVVGVAPVPAAVVGGSAADSGASAAGCSADPVKGLAVR